MIVASVSAGCKKLSHLGIHMAVGIAVVLVDDLFDGLAAHLAGIADRHELHVLLAQHPPQVKFPAGPEADGAHHDSLAGRDRAILSERPGRDDGWQEARSPGRGCRFES
jgi:hypothetical protein